MFCSKGGVSAGALDMTLWHCLQCSATNPGGSGAGRALMLQTSLQTLKTDSCPDATSAQKNSVFQLRGQSSPARTFFPMKPGRGSKGFISDPLHMHSFHTLPCQDKVRACFFKEKSLEITQAECKVEIQ